MAIKSGIWLERVACHNVLRFVPQCDINDFKDLPVGQRGTFAPRVGMIADLPSVIANAGGTSQYVLRQPPEGAN